MDALSDLTAFLHAAVRGICDDQDAVVIKSSKSGKTVTLFVECADGDLKYIYAKLTHLRALAIAIAQRNSALMNIVIDDKKDKCYVEV